jgi:hypothetical protein
MWGRRVEYGPYLFIIVFHFNGFIGSNNSAALNVYIMKVCLTYSPAELNIPSL